MNNDNNDKETAKQFLALVEKHPDNGIAVREQLKGDSAFAEMLRLFCVSFTHDCCTVAEQFAYVTD